ncbi:hypothetical protein SAMN05192561_13113 [Halopenitus malekzadehii]|uniref:DUF7847 domain-containing protein n=1 Tax=Halopenitus malekzadehii TaxID=1267564 RepID=A0A1H6K4A1_9EURY|nr:hypothetical protein [Halopenitus malekzadehii]SEH68103.1 hypothetical protein SAMN05192561_13113 [Halopenitus malekzadehii]
MALIKSLRTTPQVLRSNPVLFVPVAIFALLQVPQLFLQTVDPISSLVGSILFMAVFLFITPAFYAGTIGMSNDAVNYPCLVAAFVGSLRQGLPVSMTRFADTE